MIVLVNIHQNGMGTNIVNGTGNGCQRVGIGKYPVARFYAADTQRQLDRIATGGAGEAIVSALPFCIFHLEAAGLAVLIASQIIAVQPTTFHDFDSAINTRVGDGLLLREGFGKNCLCHG